MRNRCYLNPGLYAYLLYESSVNHRHDKSFPKEKLMEIIKSVYRNKENSELMKEVFKDKTLNDQS